MCKIVNFEDFCIFISVLNKVISILDKIINILDKFINLLYNY